MIHLQRVALSIKASVREELSNNVEPWCKRIHGFPTKKYDLRKSWKLNSIPTIYTVKFCDPCRKAANGICSHPFTSIASRVARRLPWFLAKPCSTCSLSLSLSHARRCPCFLAKQCTISSTCSLKINKVIKGAPAFPPFCHTILMSKDLIMYVCMYVYVDAFRWPWTYFP